MNDLIKWLNFMHLGDDRGSLVSLESGKIIPFDIKRVYYLFNTKMDVTRGHHAHLNLKQVLLCIKGSCKILLDDGVVRESVLLNSPTKGLFIDGLVWREMSEFSSNCVLLVIASELYNEADYIRSYEAFIKTLKLDRSDRRGNIHK